MEGGYRMVYLMWLWNCEKSIAKGISSLYSLQEAQPWKLDVDWDRYEMSLCVRKPTIWVPTRFDTNRAVTEDG